MIIDIAAPVAATSMLATLLAIDYFLIEKRIKGQLINRGFEAFSRVMQLGYINRILVFIFQLGVAIHIDMNRDPQDLLPLLLILPSLIVYIYLHAGERTRDTEILECDANKASSREIILLYLSYSIFCTAWLGPLLINDANQHLKSTAMTSITFANGISGFINAFVQEPILRRNATSTSNLLHFLSVLRTTRKRVSAIMITAGVILLANNAK